ncbi:MAG: dihydroxyacetone kinase subunit DhaL [Planctomycetaceae bacterium]
MTRVMTGVRSSARSAEPSLDAAFLRRWLLLAAEGIASQRDHLTQLDAAIGDADHGVNMDRGFSAVASFLAVSDGMPPGELLTQAGNTLMFRVGGAAGPLYGTALRELGRSLGDRRAFTVRELGEAVEAALAGIVALGAADEGDKTMVDAWAPATRALLAEAGKGAAPALGAARAAAEQGATATTPMQARKGRASYLGPRSVGHEDPGAASTAILFAAFTHAGAGSEG